VVSPREFGASVTARIFSPPAGLGTGSSPV